MLQCPSGCQTNQFSSKEICINWRALHLVIGLKVAATGIEDGDIWLKKTAWGPKDGEEIARRKGGRHGDEQKERKRAKKKKAIDMHKDKKQNKTGC